MKWQTVVLVIGALTLTLTLAVVTWLGRYEIIGVPAGGQGVYGVAYRLDRWTGQVVGIQGERGLAVKIE